MSSYSSLSKLMTESKAKTASIPGEFHTDVMHAGPEKKYTRNDWFHFISCFLPLLPGKESRLQSVPAARLATIISTPLTDAGIITPMSRLAAELGSRADKDLREPGQDAADRQRRVASERAEQPRSIWPEPKTAFLPWGSSARLLRREPFLLSTPCQWHEEKGRGTDRLNLWASRQ